jgi:hypothetical protein
MAQETQYLEQLSASTEWRVDGPQLWLEDGDGNALVFVAAAAGG